MEKQRIQIVEEMSTAGSESISNMLIDMDTHRVMINSEMEEEEYLFKLKGMKCFPRKDMTAISGGPKTGKTNWISMLLACALKDGDDRKVLDLERLREERLRVMWIDTEQSPQSTQSILKRRVCPMVLGEGAENIKEFPEELLFVFNIRSVDVDSRYDLIAEGVGAYHPDIVIIDNIRDLIHDINDGQKAQELIEKLMHMATQQRCNVVCVLHQNRSNDNRGMRGWLGTEMMNKVFEVFVCRKVRQKQGVKPTFMVEQEMTRKYDIDEPLCYQMDDRGLPVAADMPNLQPRNERGQFASYGKAKVDTLNSAYIIQQPDNAETPWRWDLRKLFGTVMGSCATMGYQDLMRAVMDEAHIRQRNYYEKVFSMAEEERVVRKDKDGCGRIVVILLPL